MLEFVAGVHLTGETASIGLTELVADTGAAGLFLFSIQVTVTTFAAVSGSIGAHLTAAPTHGQSADRCQEITGRNALGESTLFTEATAVGANRLVQSQFLDANAVVNYLIDLADIVPSVAYALDISVYRFTEF